VQVHAAFEFELASTIARQYGGMRGGAWTGAESAAAERVIMIMTSTQIEARHAYAYARAQSTRIRNEQKES